MQHVFLVGAKSLGAYGGYETFINRLTEYHQENQDIKYHVAVKANQSLFWWLAYDDIKHSRYFNKKVASQKNVMNLLGALHLMEIKYLQKITDGTNQPDVPDTQSKLFNLDNWTYHYIPLNSAMAVIDGELNVEC